MATLQASPAAGFILLTTTLLVIARISAQAILAATPPRGWNSYDSFSWIVSEQDFLANAKVVADSLQQSGYEYVVVDFLWFRKNVKGSSMSTPGFDIIDEWGRPVPDPVRWPSTAGGKGFAPIAAQVHAMGLKFGIHVMRGISTAAVSLNTPVLGAKGWRAKDIALTSRPCSWMKDCFVSVDTSTEGGKAFINSLYQQYASWGVDFIKHDCVFGADDLSVDEIQAVSEAIVSTGRPIVYSLSPGVRATTSMAKSVMNYVHMYRVTSDDWDTWGDLQLHFDVARNFASAGLVAAPGLQNSRSWPDLDMLPLGWLTDPGVRQGPHRFSSLTYDEQKLQLTLWALAKSPLIYGGDLQKLDERTFNLITNPLMLEINSHSFRNTEISAGAASGNEGTPVLRLVGCDKASNTRWSLNNQNKLCWAAFKYENQSSERLNGCLDWLNATNTSGSRTYSNVGHVQLWTSKLGKLCLSSSGNGAADLGSLLSSRFSSCSRHHGRHGRHGDEKWKLTADGKLLSRTTGQCAAVFPQVYVSRVWAARGSDGEYYVGLFNLGNEAMKVGVSVRNLVSHGTLSSPAAKIDQEWECNALDVWANKNIGVVTGALEASIPAHGCGLYSLTCNPSKR